MGRGDADPQRSDNRHDRDARNDFEDRISREQTQRLVMNRCRNGKHRDCECGRTGNRRVDGMHAD